MPSCPTCRAHYPDGVAHCSADGDTLLDDAAFSNLDPELAPGDVVGEYRIERKIGHGGFGSVYAAVHPLIGKRAALKALHREHSKNPQIVARFILEAKAVNQIRHRNIIDIFAFGTLPDGRQYFLMDLLEGRTFEALLRDRGKLSLTAALPILRGVARALDAAHAHGIAHRDLKPENVFLVSEEGGGYTPKLLDFGVAKLAAATEGGVKTRTGAPIGTPYYMSPEQARGIDVDHRTDIYALGVVCFQALTGRVPFDGDSLMDILVAHLHTPPPRMTDVDPTLLRELDAPVLRMLAKDPAERPSSAGAAIDELEAAERSTPPSRTVLRLTPTSDEPIPESLATRDTMMEVQASHAVSQPSSDALAGEVVKAANAARRAPAGPARTVVAFIVAATVGASLVLTLYHPEQGQGGPAVIADTTAAIPSAPRVEVAAAPATASPTAPAAPVVIAASPSASSSALASPPPSSSPPGKKPPAPRPRAPLSHDLDDPFAR